MGSLQDGPGDRSFSGIIPWAEEWGPEVHWETMWEDFWGSCRARGGLRAEGTVLGAGGWGGLKAWCPLGVQMGVELWEHLVGRSLGKQIMQGGQRCNLGDEL